MRLKTLLPLIFFSVIGVIFTSYFAGSVLLGQTLKPFGSITTGRVETDATPGAVGNVSIPAGTDAQGNPIAVRFADDNLLSEWVPWIIQQISILIGAISLVVFVYAGIALVIYGSNEEQLAKSVKMIAFGVIGIALAGFSYTIVANILALL